MSDNIRFYILEAKGSGWERFSILDPSTERSPYKSLFMSATSTMNQIASVQRSIIDSRSSYLSQMKEAEDDFLTQTVKALKRTNPEITDEEIDFEIATMQKNPEGYMQRLKATDKGKLATLYDKSKKIDSFIGLLNASQELANHGMAIGTIIKHRLEKKHLDDNTIIEANEILDKFKRIHNEGLEKLDSLEKELDKITESTLTHGYFDKLIASVSTFFKGAVSKTKHLIMQAKNI